MFVSFSAGLYIGDFIFARESQKSGWNKVFAIGDPPELEFGLWSYYLEFNDNRDYGIVI